MPASSGPPHDVLDRGRSTTNISLSTDFVMGGKRVHNRRGTMHYWLVVAYFTVAKNAREETMATKQLSTRRCVAGTAPGA